MSRILTWKRAWEWVVAERGFTLIEVMVAIVLMTIGLLAVANVIPGGLAMSLYGKDQTTATSLAQQKIDYYKNQTPATIQTLVGNYGKATPNPPFPLTEYFDQNANPTTQAAAYFTRDVQIQYWPWVSTSSVFVLPTPTSTAPYSAPTGGTPYVLRVSVATHWPVRGQTAYTSGNPTANGCVTASAQVSVGRGCIQLSTFVKYP